MNVVPWVVDSFTWARPEGEIRFEEVKCRSGVRTPWHDHPTTYLDLYLDGAMDASWNSGVHAHTLSLLPAGCNHRTECITDIHSFQVVLPKSWTDSLGSGRSTPSDAVVFDSSRPVHAANRLYRQFKAREDLAAIDLEGSLFDIWSAMSNEVFNPEFHRCRWLRQVEEYLEENSDQPISTSELAQIVAIHPAHLMREFRRKHRCTIGDFVRSRRIERACRLLRLNSQTAAEVAHAVGFADQSHFNRSFKALLGVTPSAYISSQSPSTGYQRHCDPHGKKEGNSSPTPSDSQSKY